MKRKKERKVNTINTPIYGFIIIDLTCIILFSETNGYPIVVFNQRARADCPSFSFLNDERGLYLFSITLLFLLSLSDNSQNRHRVSHVKVLEQ